MTDYRTLLALLLGSASTEVSDEKADRILATKVVDLCPDCKGEGVIALPEWEGATEACGHPSAPTVEQLLRWGEAVATSDWIGYGEVGVPGVGVVDSAPSLLHALRELQP